jgi:hypothetical protein
MNPSSPSEMPSLNLPLPHIELDPAKQTYSNPNTNRESIEQLPKPQTIINAVQNAALPAASPIYYAPGQNISVNQPVNNYIPVQQLMTNFPAVARDGRRIEKEWVVKIKQIINATKNDPYMQSQGIKMSKADYIKKRYNKDIKLDNG